MNPNQIQHLLKEYESLSEAELVEIKHSKIETAEEHIAAVAVLTSREAQSARNALRWAKIATWIAIAALGFSLLSYFVKPSQIASWLGTPGQTTGENQSASPPAISEPKSAE